MKASYPRSMSNLVDRKACEIVRDNGDPFLVVMQRSDFSRLMKHEDAPQFLHFRGSKDFAFRHNNVFICDLPIRVEPDESWVGNVVEPYPLVMTQVAAQIAFPGEYG